MLSRIFIKNFTLIDELLLELHNNMTVITGETGAGKSIMIDAIEFALGDRASSNLIKPGAARAEVTLHFEKIAHAVSWLKEHDLDHDDDCIIRRTLTQDGRSRFTINGTPCTGKLSREFSTLLLSIHGQHAHQALLRQDEQRRLLDGYARHEVLLDDIQRCYQQWKTTHEALQSLQQKTQDGQNQLEFICYQLAELDELGLQEGELEALEKEHKQLHHATQLSENCQKALMLLDDENHHFNHVLSLLNEAHALHPSFENCINLLKNALIHIEETRDELQHCTYENNPERLAWIEKRLSQIQTLARKHHINPEQLHTIHQSLSDEKDLLENSQATIENLEKQLDQTKQNYQKFADKLTKSRQQVAKTLSQLITEKIQQLSMPAGVLQINLSPHESKTPSPYGQESVNFTVKTNPDQPFLPLQKVVSGGELSRISLAIQVITAQQSSIPTLIFDEVDVGISGGTAEIVGNLLRTLGNKNQLLCITHLPQVAAKGHHHITVEKTQEKNATHVNIRPLNAKERITEIARLLGGLKITQQTLAHAKEMLS